MPPCALHPAYKVLFLNSMKTSGILFLTTLLVFYSCRKDSFITSPDARVTVSADTLKFDTVFVTAGSTSQTFIIKNENDQKLKLSSVKLMGGAGSAFKINTDGIIGPEITDVEIDPNDSIYVFVQVNVNPNAANLPFVIRDSIRVNYNGISKLVQLEAWGKNAHFFRNKKITVNETWNNDLPYVILGSLIVDTNRTLTINKGCNIYVHADAPVIVDGTLLVNGLKDTSNRVCFLGDRLDVPYKNFPGSWPGIFFRGSSKDNVLTYAILKNAYQAIGLQDPAPNTNPKLTLNECVIDNAYDAGIISINSSVSARNCLISNCGNSVEIYKGGTYAFTHCTMATISNQYILHKEPAVILANFININNVPATADLNALFRNCIIWGENGTVEDEVVAVKNNGAAFIVVFQNNLWKVTTPPANVVATNIINNQNPQFDSIDVSEKYYDFRIKAGSPARNSGAATGIPLDMDGKPRTAGIAPDMGCFEKQ